MTIDARGDCGDGTGYIFDIDAGTVSLYTLANDSVTVTEGPIRITATGAVGGGWIDAEARLCFYRLADPYFQNKLVYVKCQSD
jgi:hypothetical protein